MAAGVAGGETLLIGGFGGRLDVTGTVGAAATEQFAGRRATDVITGSTIHHAKHGLNGHNRNDLHNGWFFVDFGWFLTRTLQRGRGQVAVISRI